MKKDSDADISLCTLAHFSEQRFYRVKTLLKPNEISMMEFF